MLALEPFDETLAATLRGEAFGMAQAYADALEELLPDGTISGVYMKGSAHKSWDSVIDYVPELSDVDIHVGLTQPVDTVHELDWSLDLARTALDSYTRRFAGAIHKPRPQLVFLEAVERLDGYLPSPSSSVRTLAGQPYQGGTPEEYATCHQTDVDRFAEDAEFFRSELPGKVIDRPGSLLWRVACRATWRVAPAGPRLLTQLGADPYAAWTWNRTQIVRELEARGHPGLSAHYANFYIAGWEGFKNRFLDGPSAERALRSASLLYEEGLDAVGYAREYGIPS